MQFGYNTNGFAHHTLDDALAIIAELGYATVGLTVDVHHAPPGRTDRRELARQLRAAQLVPVLETGARFLLDARRKHQPTLLSPDPAERAQRRQFLLECIHTIVELGGDIVSFWSGTAQVPEPTEELFQRLAAECHILAEEAARCGVRLAFEPEPGMFIETLAQFTKLRELVNHPAFGLTIDLGHVTCLQDGEPGAILAAWHDWLWNL
ncbi:MAG: sugar phosphate isomerase/epimerase family protein, partial [Gemmataceae bacterium]